MKFLKKLLVILLIAFSKSGNAQSIEEMLKGIESIAHVEKIIEYNSEVSSYKLLIKQPIDHDDLKKGYFLQKVYLTHNDFHKPVIFYINGYIALKNKLSPWTQLFDANQVYVEHRFYGNSKPDSIHWSALNIKNAANDLHRIRQTLGKIYKSNWLSTGISKGGLTAVSYKYFYPDDVKATIAQSTSIKDIQCDTLFFNFIDSLNYVNGCDEKIKEFQRTLLERRKELILHLKNYLDSKNKPSETLGLDKVFDLAVLEVPFSLWQNKDGCSSIVENETSSLKLFEALHSSVGGWFLTDDLNDVNTLFGYQAATELGYYCYPTYSFKNLLVTSESSLPSIILPQGIVVNYSNELMRSIKEWLINKGNNIIYISGGNDPYSLYKIVPSASVNSLSITLSGRNHNQATYNQLSNAQQQQLKSLVDSWLK